LYHTLSCHGHVPLTPLTGAVKRLNELDFAFLCLLCIGLYFLPVIF
jgi:hypothetical protein